MSDLTDINFFLTDLDTKLFPGVTHAVQVHNGFGAEHAKTAATILAETKRIIADKGATQVMLVRNAFPRPIMSMRLREHSPDIGRRLGIPWVARWRSWTRSSWR